MKAISEIAKTTSVVQKENTLIDIKFRLNLPSLIPALMHRVWQRASIPGYNEHPNEVDSLQWIKQISDTIFEYKKSEIKAKNISETTTLTEGTLFLSNGANEAGSLGRIECCVVIGTVQSGTETVSLKQR